MKAFSIVLPVLALSSTAALAGNVFSITNRGGSLSTATDPASVAIYQAANAAADSIVSDINTKILNDATLQPFLDGVSAANVAACTDLGVDRASTPGRASLTFGAQAGFNGGTAFSVGGAGGANSIPATGIAVQPSVGLGISASSLGLKLGSIDAKRLMIYVNTGYYSTTLSGVQINMFNIGSHFDYKLVEPKGNFLFGWGGIDLVSGLSYSSISADYAASLSQTEGTGQASMSLNMAYDLGIKATNFTIPVELSTNVTLFYLFTAYFGGGVDLNFGKTAYTGGGSGPIATSGGEFTGTAVLDMSQGPSSGPSFVTGRSFGGFQANLGWIKFFMQGDYYTNKTVGAALGARVAF